MAARPRFAAAPRLWPGNTEEQRRNAEAQGPVNIPAKAVFARRELN